MKSLCVTSRSALHRSMPLLLSALFLLSTFPARVFGESILEYNSRTWQADEGLPHNQVLAITQTPDGYLWVGTREGLARFDGVSFTRFTEQECPGLTDSYVNALYTDRSGALWIGTFGGLVCVKDGICSRYAKTNGLVGDEINAIIQSRDGSMWIGTAEGLSRYKDGKFTDYTQKDGLLSDMISSVYEDDDENIWVASARGLNRLKGTVIDSFTMANGLPDVAIKAVCQDQSGRLWVGSNNGLSWYDHGRFQNDIPEHHLPDSFIDSMCKDSQGNFWVGTHSGLVRFKGGACFNELSNEGAPYDKVNTLFEDREGNIWAGAREGLIRRTPKQFLTYAKPKGLTHNNVMAIQEDQQGNVWLSTWGGGLNRLNDGRVTAYARSNGFPFNLVLAVTEGRDGSLWAGADFDGGLVRFKNGEYTRYTWRDGLINGPIRVIHEDCSGNIWVGTSKGLSCLKDGKFTNYTTNEHLAGDLVRAICEDHAGNLWIGTHKGLSRWKNGKFINYTERDGLSETSVIAVYEDKQNNLWIGTLGGGLNRYKNGHFTAYTTLQGLFSDDVFEIVEDDHGYLWMSCARGIFRVLKASLDALDEGKIKALRCFSYGKSDGVESTQCNGVAKPSGIKTRDGRIWFPTTKGAIVSDPAFDQRSRELPPPVCIEEIIADNRKTRLGFWRPEPGQGADPQTSSQAGNESAPIIVPPGRGEFEFHYTALSLSAAENNRFKYKLEGVDSDWVDVGTHRLAHYNNLYPGKYCFRVIACNDHGAWNEIGAAVTFVLLPHFWQRWWFISLGAVMAIGSVGGGFRYLMWQKLRRKLALLEMQNSLEKERARIARDIHDDLGATLTQITLLSELTQRESSRPEQVTRHAGQIALTARDLVQAMDEIVWAINPQNDNLPRLAGYIIQYAEKFFSGTSLRCRFDSPSNLPEQPVSAEARHHLFLTTKEALNNVARHASATEVWLRLQVVENELQICIEDNGKGFAADSVRSFGNGLKNMKKRLEEIGGVFELESHPGIGTKIRLKLKFQQ